MSVKTNAAGVALLCLAATACASGAPRTPPAAPNREPLPETRGFAGGTQVQGGFRNQASAIVDSTVTARPAAVWSALPRVFASLEIEATTVQRSSYTIGNQGARVSRIAGSRRLSQYLDCGAGIRGANADTYDVTLQLLVRLAPGATEQTIVRTTLDAYARPRDSAGEPIHCASQGTLEREILAMISSELVRMEGAVTAEAPGALSSSATGLAPMSPGRIPVTGDLLRIECRSPGSGESLVGLGRYAGAGNGTLHILPDARGGTVAVPAVNVHTVRIRERRTYGKAAAIVGFVAGATVGGLYASSRYDADATYHFRPAVLTTVGGIIGGVVGGVLGGIAGSLIRSDTWHDAPPEWALRTSGLDPALALSVPPTLCPGF